MLGRPHPRWISIPPSAQLLPVLHASPRPPFLFPTCIPIPPPHVPLFAMPCSDLHPCDTPIAALIPVTTYLSCLSTVGHVEPLLPQCQCLHLSPSWLCPAHSGCGHLSGPPFAWGSGKVVGVLRGRGGVRGCQVLHEQNPCQGFYRQSMLDGPLGKGLRLKKASTISMGHEAPELLQNAGSPSALTGPPTVSSSLARN